MKLEHVKSILYLFLAILFFSCESSDDSIENSKMGLAEIKATATSGSWLVARFEEDQVDQTSNFSGYSFTFNTDGVLNADKEDQQITGSWSITSDSSSNEDESNDDSSSDDSSSDDDDSSDDVDFNIFFSSSSKLEELSEDWEIVSYTDTRIELKHISGGDGSIDILVFEKE
ncbi:hypothetical protein [Maribacter sp. MAR_2009_72]|uniref:hypothetical protein n=1 Tax=Maribacter sp. MAR_2009_72 TaxID=1250050 RepID=UPI00119C1921|nr:hypothetical protein [Maribacter sp. MAR_2009_72]TVZ16886.1 hypothetical protein JM81_3158 [Maribacter sp. MAR_2009_72]